MNVQSSLSNDQSLVSRRFFGITIGLGLLTLLLRLPFRSHALYIWDSVNFALGMEKFDVFKHQPHSPGYILYEGLGWLVKQLTGEANSSLVWISIISGVLAVWFTLAFAWRRFGPADAVYAAILLVSNALMWFYDELALTYSAEAFFTIAIAYACYRTIQGSVKWAYAGAILLGLAGGVRQTTLLIMLPLALYTARWLNWRQRLATGSLLAGICLAWSLPLLALSGGLGRYLQATALLSSIIAPDSAAQLLHAIFYAGHIPLILVVLYWLGLYKIPGGVTEAWERTFLLLWVAPGLALIALRHVGQSGYVLFLLPPLFIYTPTLARAAYQELEAHWPVREGQKPLSLQAKVYSLLGVIVLVNVVSFFLRGLPLIAVQGFRWAHTGELAAQYPPAETVVLTSLDMFVGFRHASYYLPEYHVYGLDTYELEGPFKVEKPFEIITGWVFESYQRHDNYDLDPSTHQLNTTLDLPPGTNGILFTGQTLWDELEAGNPGAEIKLVNYSIGYMRLPPGARRLVIGQGEIQALP